MADQPKCEQPEGMESYDLGGADDLGALSKEQQERLNKKKISTRLANEKYLRGHPEVACLMSSFLREAFLKRPENIREFAAEYFNDPMLPERIEEELKTRDAQFGDMKVLQNLS